MEIILHQNMSWRILCNRDFSFRLYNKITTKIVIGLAYNFVTRIHIPRRTWMTTLKKFLFLHSSGVAASMNRRARCKIYFLLRYFCSQTCRYRSRNVRAS